MKVGRTIALLAGALVAVLLLTGCGGDDAKNDAGASKPEAAAPSGVDTKTVEPDQKTDAGPWTVVVKDMKRGSKFGLHTADEGGLVLVKMELTNNHKNPVPVEERDFSLTDGENYTIALDGDKDYLANATIEPGETKKISAVFYVPPYIKSSDLTFVFQNAAVEMMRIEVPLK